MEEPPRRDDPPTSAGGTGRETEAVRLLSSGCLVRWVTFGMAACGLTFAGGVVAAFLVLSGLLVIATLFPDLALGWSVMAISEAAAAALGELAGLRLGDGGAGPSPRSPTSDSWWTMPPIESLRPPAASRSRTLSLILLRGYLVLAVIAVVVKVVRLMMGA